MLVQRGVVLPHITVVVMLLMIDSQATYRGPLLCRLRLVVSRRLIYRKDVLGLDEASCVASDGRELGSINRVEDYAWRDARLARSLGMVESEIFLYRSLV